MTGAGAAWVETGLHVAALIAMGKGTAMKVDEAVGDYEREIVQIEARQGEVAGETARKIAGSRQEGVLALKEQGAQSAFESRMAMTQTELVTSGEESRLGKSGVRMGGSPLLAAQQNVDLAAASADRTVERGMAGMAIGGVRLQNTLSDITAQGSLVTSEFERRRKEARYKRKELKDNKTALVAVSAAGGLGGLATSFYNLGNVSGWWD